MSVIMQAAAIALAVVITAAVVVVAGAWCVLRWFDAHEGEM